MSLASSWLEKLMNSDIEFENTARLDSAGEKDNHQPKGNNSAAESASAAESS